MAYHAQMGAAYRARTDHWHVWVVLLWCLTFADAGQARAAAEPRGAHPRLFLSPVLSTQWRDMRSKPGAVADAIAGCRRAAQASGSTAKDHYMGLDWARALQACLVAWAATNDDAHAKTAMRYFVALLDDLSEIGDGKGGDEAARRDSGFAMRALGPYTALAYDWLHAHPLMTTAIKARARQRFAAWTSWYANDGYRARAPGTNYHAGYLLAATWIAIAQAGEAGAAGTALWRLVDDELWQKDMHRALSRDGLLEGGDWSEGWQYGPLAVASYALAGRALRDAGGDPGALTTWADALLLRHLAARTPSGDTFVAGDTSVDAPYLPWHAHTLAAIAIAGSDQAARWALTEMRRPSKRDARDDFPFILALAAARDVRPSDLDDKTLGTSYLARGSGNWYVRTRSDDNAIWTVWQCVQTLNVDHAPANAGNLVLSRGRDDVLVDPSPYGTLSTLTSNAPTVESKLLPPDYRPGQGYWSERTRWTARRQFVGGAAMARCDYADAYRFQERASDIPRAIRDFVLVPWRQGRDAALVVIDEADTTDADRALHLRFRTQGKLALTGKVSRATVGQTALQIEALSPKGAVPTIVASSLKDCFGANTKRGNCNAARFPVTEHRLLVPGPSAIAAHVVSAGTATAAKDLTARGGNAWSLTAGDEAAVIARGDGGATLTYDAPARAALHLVVGAPVRDGRAAVEVTRRGDTCLVAITAGNEMDAWPLAFTVDAQCRFTRLATAPTLDATMKGLASTDGVPPADTRDATIDAATSTASATDQRDDSPATVPTASPASSRAGCVRAQTLRDGNWLTSLLIMALWRRRG